MAKTRSASKHDHQTKDGALPADSAAPKGLEFLDIRRLDDRFRVQLEDALIEHVAQEQCAQKSCREGTPAFRMINLKVLLPQLRHQVCKSYGLDNLLVSDRMEVLDSDDH